MLPIPHKYSKTFHRRGSKQGVTYQNTSFSGNISLISLERAKISNFELFGSRAFLKKELKKSYKSLNEVKFKSCGYQKTLGSPYGKR